MHDRSPWRPFDATRSKTTRLVGSAPHPSGAGLRSLPLGTRSAAPRSCRQPSQGGARDLLPSSARRRRPPPPRRTSQVPSAGQTAPRASAEPTPGYAPRPTAPPRRAPRAACPRRSGSAPSPRRTREHSRMPVLRGSSRRMLRSSKGFLSLGLMARTTTVLARSPFGLPSRRKYSSLRRFMSPEKIHTHLKWRYRHAGVLTVLPGGRSRVDLTRFDEVTACAPTAGFPYPRA